MVGVVHGNMGSKITKVVDDSYADVSSGCDPGLVDDCRISASDTRSAVSPTAAITTITLKCVEGHIKQEGLNGGRRR